MRRRHSRADLVWETGEQVPAIGGIPFTGGGRRESVAEDRSVGVEHVYYNSGYPPSRIVEGSSGLLTIRYLMLTDDCSLCLGQRLIQLVNGGYAGRNFAFFNAIKGFRADAGTFG